MNLFKLFPFAKKKTNFHLHVKNLNEFSVKNVNKQKNLEITFQVFLLI